MGLLCSQRRKEKRPGQVLSPQSCEAGSGIIYVDEQL
jgi:hypothetical protein